MGSLPVRTGVLRLLSTLWKNFDPGNAPSLEKAYIIRELDVIEKMPAKNIHPNITTYSYSGVSYRPLNIII